MLRVGGVDRLSSRVLIPRLMLKWSSNRIAF